MSSKNCSSSSQCNDNNTCTYDTCSAGSCKNTARPAKYKCGTASKGYAYKCVGTSIYRYQLFNG